MGLRTLALVGSLTLFAAACSGGSAVSATPQTASPPPSSSDPGSTGVAEPSGTQRSSTTGAEPAGAPASDAGAAKAAIDFLGSTTGGDSDDAPEDVALQPEVTPGSASLDGPVDVAGSARVELLPADPGDSGPHVVTLQARLAELGFAPGARDGSYGRRTSGAIKAFQELVGLTPTGTADLVTVEALAAYHYDGLLLRAGDSGPAVETLQERLGSGPFDPGPIDGEYGSATTKAVWALEKLAGVPVDGNWGPLDERAWELLMSGQIGTPEKDHDQRWVEVDLSQQVMKVYDPGSTIPTLVSHASSGSGIPWENEEHSGSSITPLGDFHINRRISGWRESSLNIGRLYNPLYFNGGIAFHGAQSVPLYPASHGCVRLPMHIAEYLPSELPNGTPVHVVP